MVTFSDVDVVVVVEKEVGSDKHSLPYIIRRANEKTLQENHAEIRRTQSGGFSSEREAIDEQKSRDKRSILIRMFNPYSLPRFVRMIYGRGFRTDPFKVKRVMGTTGITSVGMFGRGGGWPITWGRAQDETASPYSNSQQRERQQTDLKITGTTKTHSKNN